MAEYDPTAGCKFQQATRVTAGSNTPIDRIVMHGTVSRCFVGGAQATANYFSGAAPGGSAHYCVDPATIIQCVAENGIAWHAPPNSHSLGFELVDPVLWVQKRVNGVITETAQSIDSRFTSEEVFNGRWDWPDYDKMLRLAAAGVRAMCLKYNVPMVRIDSGDLLEGRRGICGHIDVSLAWKQTSHTDPQWPDHIWSRFIGYVNLSGPAPSGGSALTIANITVSGPAVVPLGYAPAYKTLVSADGNLMIQVSQSDLDMMKAAVIPPPVTPPPIVIPPPNTGGVPALPPQSAFAAGQRNDGFTWMGDQFKRILGTKIRHDGNGYQSGPVFSEYDAQNVRLVQEYGYGDVPDGWFGSRQWNGLAVMGDISGKIPSGGTPPPSTVPVLPPSSAFVPGQSHPSFTWMGQQFIRILGNKIKASADGYQPGPGYSAYDEENVKLVQQYGYGNTPDGWFGPTQWNGLPGLGDISGKIPAGGSTPPPPTGGSITTPFPGAVVGTPFGVKGSWAAGFHTGRDYPCPINTPLRSTWTAKVVATNAWGTAYGIHVIMEHTSNGVVHRIAYCHMNSISVRVGDIVKPDQNVGRSGNTGNSTGPHCHVEDRIYPFGYNNRVVNPIL